jgi:hypothetical protein
LAIARVLAVTVPLRLSRLLHEHFHQKAYRRAQLS